MTPFGVLKWVRRIATLMLVAAVGVYVAAVIAVWWSGREDSQPRSDVIVVMGASEYNGRPSQILRYRLLHAEALYRKHVAPRIVTVGGRRPGDVYTEATVGQRFLEKDGIPAAAIVAVPMGNDTLESLKAAQKVFRQNRWGSAVIVTDPWHALRAKTMADDVGLHAHVSPVHSGPAVQGRWTELHYILREAAAYLYYKFLGGSPAPGGPGAV